MTHQKSKQRNRLIAGIDDATKCPCIGSIFIVGVVADDKSVRKWKSLGVKDSKLLTPKRREHLAGIIKETAHQYIICELTPSQIDDKCFNLNEWEMLTVLQIVSRFDALEQIEEVIVDNWEVKEEKFAERLASMTRKSLAKLLKEKNVDINRERIPEILFKPEHYADETYTIVGAASILAKTSSDKQYADYREKYGDFGSGSPGDPLTRLFVWQHRKNPLPIIRTSWQTFKDLSVIERIEADELYATRSGNIAGRLERGTKK